MNQGREEAGGKEKYWQISFHKGISIGVPTYNIRQWPLFSIPFPAVDAIEL